MRLHFTTLSGFSASRLSIATHTNQDICFASTPCPVNHYARARLLKRKGRKRFKPLDRNKRARDYSYAHRLARSSRFRICNLRRPAFRLQTSSQFFGVQAPAIFLRNSLFNLNPMRAFAKSNSQKTPQAIIWVCFRSSEFLDVGSENKASSFLTRTRLFCRTVLLLSYFCTTILDRDSSDIAGF